MTTSPGHAHEYHIKINGREKSVVSDRVTYEQAVELAGYPAPIEGTEYIVTYRRAVEPHSDGDLIAGEYVIIKNGTDFVVEPGNRS